SNCATFPACGSVAQTPAVSTATSVAASLRRTEVLLRRARSTRISDLRYESPYQSEWPPTETRVDGVPESATLPTTRSEVGSILNARYRQATQSPAGPLGTDQPHPCAPGRWTVNLVSPICGSIWRTLFCPASATQRSPRSAVMPTGCDASGNGSTWPVP